VGAPGRLERWTAGLLSRAARLGALDAVAWCHQRLPSREAVPREAAPPSLDVVSIAFNNEVVIEEQIRLVRRHLRDPHVHAIADNSPEAAGQARIREACARLEAPYFRIPRNPFTGISPSHSHGAALNWVYSQYILPRGAACFGFLDHDVFPVRPTAILPRLKEFPVFGHPQERPGGWHLWAGFCFFTRDVLRLGTLDFRPRPGFDTGGSSTIFRHLDRSRLPALDHRLERFREGDDPQHAFFEVLGDWIHTFNASYWMAGPSKEADIKKLLAGC
jgi:hypothetical protein